VICPTPCHPFCAMPCATSLRKSQSDSSSTYRKEPVVTTSVIGSVEPDTRSQPRPSSDTERALRLLDEAFTLILGLPKGKARDLALDCMTDAGSLVKAINV
jgi:hypothetical protein